MPDSVTLWVNGQAVSVPRGATVAAAVYIASHDAFRRSITGEARGPLCGMGICFECRLTVDGRAHVRSCLLPAGEGMRVDVP